MRLTENFTLAEMTASQTAARQGIDNTPPESIIPALIKTAQGLERVRKIIGSPITVTSGYRSPELNLFIGSKNTSQHVKGQAADVVVKGLTALHVAQKINKAWPVIKFDQLILEYPNSPSGGWVHVSFTDAPRGQALTIKDASKASILGLVP